MQTFLPHPELGASAAALDDRRLGKDPEAYAALDVDDPLEPYVWPDPPADPAPPPPFSAWVVRAADPDDAAAQAQGGVVTVRSPHPDGSTTRKQQRQRDRFAQEVATGDRVVLSDGATLRVGRIDGPVTQDAAGTLVRPVTYTARCSAETCGVPGSCRIPPRSPACAASRPSSEGGPRGRVTA